MFYRFLGLISLGLITCLPSLFAQSSSLWDGDVGLHMAQYQTDPLYQMRHDALEAHTSRVASGLEAASIRAVLNVPVVIHVMHAPSDSVPGNGSYLDADRIQAGLDRLNEAFRNQGAFAGGPKYSDAKTLAGVEAVDTEIEFCLANLAPDGSAMQGIDYVSTELADVDFSALYAPENRSEDAAMKARAYLDANQYLNIWLVRSVCEDKGVGCDTRGYAYLPGAHGSALDGVVVESAYWGENADSMQVPIFYVGRYLNLWATSFRSINTLPCTNDQCLLSGDRVCDTPPDATQGGPGCGLTENSCDSDGMDGDTDRNPFATVEVQDIWENFMDLGPEPACTNTFTEGQKLRMREALMTARNSLLNGIRCQPPAADCVIPSQIPDKPGTYVATVRCTDDLGWTHFFKAATDTPAQGQALLLASFRSSDQVEQTWAPETIKMVLTENYGQGAHVLSDAPYVDNNSGWYVSGRYLHLPAGLSGQNLIMRVYYDKTDLDDLDQALMPQLRQGPLDLTPYAIAGEADPRDEHASVDVSEFNWYEAHARGDVDQWAVWQDSNLQAAVLEPMGAQTIGLGSGGLGRGYGPQYPKLVPELSGALVQGKPVLSWDTEREWDLEDFVVMRSRNGGTFEKTGLLAANRDGLPWPMTRSYDWKGDTLGAGSYRYFVKGLHGSGWSWYSDTITLEKGPEPTAEFLDVKVFPNPARDQIKIDLTVETATPVTLQILDGMRRSVRQYAWTQQPGEIPTMSLQGLQPGIYFYQISNGPQVRQGKLLVFFR